MFEWPDLEKCNEITKTGQKLLEDVMSKIPCANANMDKWEDENLPLSQRRKPRMLYCGCPRCNPMSF